MNLANTLPNASHSEEDMAVSVQATAYFMSRYICLLALNPTAPEALSVKGTVNLTTPDCVIQANSKSNSALYSNGGAQVEAFSICAVGNSLGSPIQRTPVCRVFLQGNSLNRPIVITVPVAPSTSPLRSSSGWRRNPFPCL